MLLEFFLGFGRVAAHTKNLEVFGMEGFERVPQRTRLSRAARRSGLRVEKNKRRPLRIHCGKIQLRAVLVGGHDFRCLGADLQGFDFADKGKKTHNKKRNRRSG